MKSQACVCACLFLRDFSEEEYRRSLRRGGAVDGRLTVVIGAETEYHFCLLKKRAKNLQHQGSLRVAYIPKKHIRS